MNIIINFVILLLLGFPDIEDKDNWHGKPLGDKADYVIKHLEGQLKNLSAAIQPFNPVAPEISLKVSLNEPPSYKLGDKVSLQTNNTSYFAARSIWLPCWRRGPQKRRRQCWIARPAFRSAMGSVLH